jgi:hypothetical protein
VGLQFESARQEQVMQHTLVFAREVLIGKELNQT